MPLTDARLMERLNERNSPAAALLGARVLELDGERGFARIRFEALPAFCNAMGGVQGGFLAAMLDEAAATAALVKARSRVGVPTLEFKVSFFAPAKAGELIAEAQVVRMGRRITFIEADLMDPEGRLIARLSTTAMPVPNENPRLVAS